MQYNPRTAHPKKNALAHAFTWPFRHTRISMPTCPNTHTHWRIAIAQNTKELRSVARQTNLHHTHTHTPATRERWTKKTCRPQTFESINKESRTNCNRCSVMRAQTQSHTHASAHAHHVWLLSVCVRILRTLPTVKSVHGWVVFIAHQLACVRQNSALFRRAAQQGDYAPGTGTGTGSGIDTDTGYWGGYRQKCHTRSHGK